MREVEKEENAEEELPDNAVAATSANQQPLPKQALDKSPCKAKYTLIGNILLWLVFLLAIAAGSMAFYNHKQLQQLALKIDITDEKENINQHIIDGIEQRLQAASASFNAVNSKLNGLESSQESLKNRVLHPATKAIESNETFALAEVEQLLTIANFRLQLNNDIATALIAMEAADLRLQRLDLPGVLQAREQLIADRNYLRSLNQADLSGLALFLSDLIDRVDALPLNKDVAIQKSEFERDSVGTDDESKFKTFFKLAWVELKNLVVITRDQNVTKAMILPDEEYYLRANIKLELANARFAVFNRDTENFNAAVVHIQAWLVNYFDKSDTAVSNIYESLRKMQRLDLAFPEVDINSSIESVKALAHRLDDMEQ